jgi:hypothetical protein
MAIDWSNEPFARLYKRETDDDLMLTWQARAVWHEFLKRCDRSGLVATRRGAVGLAALLRIPLDVIETAMDELAEDGRVRLLPEVGWVAPNYVAANFTARSNAARQAAFRMVTRVNEVTDSNAQSHGVTESNDASQNTHSDQISTDHITPSKPAKRKTALPADWSPRSEEREKAVSTGLNCDTEVDAFRDHHSAKGTLMLDWNAAFRTWLRNAVKFARGGNGQAPKVIRQSTAEDDEPPPQLFQVKPRAQWGAK